uniref:Protein kinase domain-containing protein n=1 Tax=Panagrolaimus davidi TaxID=227884 RepID=A0A914QUD5_9BILA
MCYYYCTDDTARCVGCLKYIKYDKVRKIFLTNPAEGHGPVVTKEGKCKFGSNEIKEKQFQILFLVQCEGKGIANLEMFKANFKACYEPIFGKMTAKVRDSMRRRIERALVEKVANNPLNEIDNIFRFETLFPGEAVVAEEPTVPAENVEVTENDAIPQNNDPIDEGENDLERAESEADEIEQSMIDLSLRDFDTPNTPPPTSTLPPQPQEGFTTPRQNYIKSKRRHQIDSVVGRFQNAKDNLEKLAGHPMSKKDFLENKMVKKIGKEIGSGAYGKVYEALMNDGQKVALKVIILTKQECFESASFEIDMMKRLKALRPFPQSSKDREENEYLKAVFMIEMGGQQLEEYLINTPEEFLSIFSQVCSFMATGEKMLELEHRDAHVSNILVEKTAKEGSQIVLNSKKYFVKNKNILVKLIDFGQSRIRDGKV